MQAATPKRETDLERLFALAFLALLALGLASQAAILAEALERNPFARTPVNDARVYWEWAGEIARGRLVGATPFLSAPLYPYLIGIVRALGGGLAAVYVLQALLHVGGAALIGRIGMRRFSPAVGLGAAALFLLLADPAACTARVLNGTLQVFVVAWLWERMIAVEDSPRPAKLLGLGATLGLSVLANPTMLVAVPLVALWTRRRAGRRAALVVGALALALIAPATLHNWLACGELIPVSAQAGVTFVHGNAPGADGTYHPIEGISADRIKQNVDARALVAGATDGSWGATSSHFLRQGLAWWRSDPRAAARLVLRKLYWFVSGRDYGDIYVPALEIEDGIASRLRLAPIPVAWLTLPALLVLLGLWQRREKHFPEALLLLAPLLTVAVFWYSPRYRIPAVPVLCVLGAQSIAAIRERRSVALAAALGIGIGLGTLNRAIGFDDRASYRGQYEQALGTALVEQGQLEEGALHYRIALHAGHPDAAAALGDALRRLGHFDEALEALRDAVSRSPTSAYARRGLAVALAQAGRLADARKEFEAALSLDPNDWESLSGLGNVLLALGAPEAAIERYEAALRLHPGFASARYNLGCALEAIGRLDEAERAFTEALAQDPTLSAAARRLEILRARKPSSVESPH